MEPLKKEDENFTIEARFIRDVTFIAVFITHSMRALGSATWSIYHFHVRIHEFVAPEIPRIVFSAGVWKELIKLLLDGKVSGVFYTKISECGNTDLGPINQHSNTQWIARADAKKYAAQPQTSWIG